MKQDVYVHFITLSVADIYDMGIEMGVTVPLSGLTWVVFLW